MKPQLLILFLLLITLVLAAPSKFSNEPTSDSLEIRMVEAPAIQYDRNLSLKVHVFNTSSGMPITAKLSCDLHLYNASLKHIAEITSITPEHTYDYEFSLNASNFPQQGYYPFIVQCNTSKAGGYYANYIEATSNGRAIREDLSPIAAMILLPLGFIFLLVIGMLGLSDAHAAFKIAMYLLIPVFFFASLHFSLITITNFYFIEELQDFIGSTTYWISIIVGVIFSYFMIYLIYKTIRLAAQEKNEKLEY